MDLVEVSMLPSTSVDLCGMVTAAGLDLVNQSRPTDAKKEPDSRIGSPSMQAGVQQTAPRRPQLKLMTPDRPVRYLPIHVW